MGAQVVAPDVHGHGRVVLSGDIDLASVAAVSAAIDDLQAMRPAQVTVELGGVTFLDSSGVRELVRANRAFPAPVSVVGVTPAIERVLEMTGLLDLLVIHAE